MIIVGCSTMLILPNSLPISKVATITEIIHTKTILHIKMDTKYDHKQTGIIRLCLINSRKINNFNTKYPTLPITVLPTRHSFSNDPVTISLILGLQVRKKIKLGCVEELHRRRRLMRPRLIYSSLEEARWCRCRP